ncbi:TrpG2: anthranilate synthase, component II [Desulfosarcina variabilis str. Montpellier]|jgi:anthranilate synthase/aminodeoxychorismate synthase-like glutamine amidotransferase|uniref:anthranilate synthase component II n=1 Tax=Desulfosarcina variabilis TaxID=2300 RepID=UPI003AFA1C90
MILMIDNYDSFTYNLVQYLRQIGEGVEVKRNDMVSIAEIEAMAPQAIVVSPGPGRPESAGVSLETIHQFSGKVPILGVCLGHQSIAHAFGARIVPAKRLMHGKTSSIASDGKGVFCGIKPNFQAMRYHSLAVEKESLPECLKITALAEDGEIMGIRHRTHPTEGIQFHPESIMTPVGKRLLRNFLKKVPERIKACA